jgi:uncharacterized membrane protein
MTRPVLPDLSHPLHDQEKLMNDPLQQSMVATYDSHDKAEAAIKVLQAAGLDMTRMSIVGRDFHTAEHALGFYTSGDRMKFWGSNGAFWGGLWGLLAGGALFVVPVIGPLVVMGPLVAALVGVIEGAALGGSAGVLAAALASTGIPDNRTVKYELDVQAGNFLVIVNGTADMVTHARAMLGTTSATRLDSPDEGLHLTA